jgi:hypothetical protein
MQVQIKQGTDLSGAIFALTEEDAMRKIKDHYPHAVSAPWEPDNDRLDAGGQPKGQIKLVYENQASVGREAGVVARIRRYNAW